MCGLAIAATGLAACGSGDGDEASDAVDYSAASEPPSTFALRLAKLLETTKAKRDCAQVDAISARSLTRFGCPPNKGFSKSMASFKIVGAKEYGTGAIVDYTSGEVPDGATIVLYASPSRDWGVSRFGVLTKPSTDTSDEKTRAGFRRTVDAYLDAVRKRDCKAFAKVTFNGDADTATVCKTVFPGTLAVAAALKKNPDAEPKYQGGNGTYGFFTVETAKPTPANATISVVKSVGTGDNAYAVLNIANSPTAKQQRDARKALKQPQKKRSNLDMSPSSTAEE